MTKKLHIKKGDQVKVMAGNAKGETGRVVSVDRKTNRALVEGLNMVKRHVKPTASSPQGGIIEKEAGIHVSNLMLVDPATKEVSRIGRKQDDNGKLVRYYKKSGEVVK
ncbi:MAG: 50S ribosomal protein L24 [Cryomorphaceae bacterium]|nr:MAG: 50S ribosomal protein L24 [Cryomorphaceae bacterium]